MFPSGFVEYGEHPIEALVREVNEETGLSVAQPSLIDLRQSEDDPREPAHFAFFYELGKWKGELRNDPVENDGVDWFSLDRLPKVGLKLHAHFLGEYAKRLSKSESANQMLRQL
jgi:8-oxo-dGTP diphosphatase